MKNRIFILAFFFACAACLSSCDDLIDKNLAGSELKIDNPADNFVATNYNIVFLWEPVKGTSSFHIQIAQPNFNNIQQLNLDTIIQGTKLVFPLYPGAYQWRIRAENGTSSSDYITRNIKVDSNSDLNGQTFFVSSPQNNFVTNHTIVNFTWGAFPYADLYQYVLLDNSSNTFHSKYTDQLVVVDTIPEGVYTWRAKAFDTVNGTATQFSTPYTITIDLTPPSPPVLVSPANNSIDTNIITVSWTHASDVYADSLLVASDSLFQDLKLSTYLVGKTSYILDPLTINQTYYWLLRSRDLAGNWSTRSGFFRFNVH